MILNKLLANNYIELWCRLFYCCRGGIKYKIIVPVFIAAFILFLIVFQLTGPSEDDLIDHVIKPDPLVMVWEHAAVTPDPDTIEPMKAVQVVSPTWLHVIDRDGSIEDLTDLEYIAWARNHGYQIWVLVTNSFDPGITADILTSESKRLAVASDIVEIAVYYGFEGINIDFENFSGDYRDEFSSFIADLALLCRENEIILSVDVTMVSTSEYWSLGYDRGAIAELADYLVIMAYDEHWQASPVAGSVASLPWVERGLARILEDVPPEQIILGVPFYTRLFEVDVSGDIPIVLNSWSYSMHRAEEIIENYDAEIYWDEEAGQHVARYEKDNLTYIMWLENETSMRQRLELVNKYQLAGVAAWRRGLENPEIWDLFVDKLTGN